MYFYSYMILPQVEKFVVQQILASEVVRIDVFYLTTEPYPVKTWIDTKSHSNTLLFSRVVDFEVRSRSEISQDPALTV